jgi:hypothetical protein
LVTPDLGNKLRVSSIAAIRIASRTRQKNRSIKLARSFETLPTRVLTAGGFLAAPSLILDWTTAMVWTPQKEEARATGINRRKQRSASTIRPGQSAHDGASKIDVVQPFRLLFGEARRNRRLAHLRRDCGGVLRLPGAHLRA